MSPILLALALALGSPPPPPAPHVLVTVDTVRVIEFRHGAQDILEAVALKAGIVKQGNNLRL